MRRDWMRKTCLILCMALCLSGSAMAAEGKVAMGRYAEVPLDIPAEAWRAFAQANGTIYAVDGSGDNLLKCMDLSKDNWDILETGHDEDASPAQGGVNGIAVTADGALYLSSGWAMLNEENYPYVERIKGGKSECVQLDRKLNTGSDQLQLCALPSGELMGLSDTEVYRFSQDGETLQKYAVSGGESIAVYENEIAICSTGNSLISVLDIQSGQVLRALPLPGSADYGVVGYDANGALYYVCPDGLYQVNADSTLMMQIADGKLMSISKPSVEARALLFDAENNPIIAYSQGGTTSLIAYHFDENVATEPGVMLSVFALYDNATLRQCAGQFQQLNPDVMVDIIVALPQGTSITRDDVIRTLNTEMLAGKGPDVLVLDGLPVQSYIDKDVLRDLSSVVQPIIDSGESHDRIMRTFSKKGTVPAVPTRFLLPTIWGDVEGMETIEDMANRAEFNPDELPYFAVDIETLIGTFYLSCAPAWFTANGRLDDAKIELFLSALKRIRGNWTYEASVQKTGWDYKADYESRSQISQWNPYNTSAIGRYGMREESGGGALMIQGLQKQLPFLLRGGDNMTLPVGMLADVKPNDFAALPGQSQGCYVPTLIMGVNKGTTCSEVATKFIAYALSAEAQCVDLWEGLPVNKGALDAILSQKSTSSGTITGGMNWCGRWPDQTHLDRLRGIINELKTPVIPDFTLYQMIVAESTPFFEGKIDAKQAARNVCAKANAYLSE